MRRLAGSAASHAVLALALLTAAAPAQVPPADSAGAAQPVVSPVGPVPPAQTAPGPLSPGARLVFDRDSVLWASGYTLADLLSEVPGVTAARTGYAGQPAPVLYGGRGTAGLEIFSDGVPLAAVGPDSVAVDPGRISLTGLRRVEVERHPAFLRVYLVSEREPRFGARSYLRILSGDYGTAGYAGVFQYRWVSGLAVDLTADYFNGPGGQGRQRNARWFDARAQADWTPSRLVSGSLQLWVQTLDREASVTENGPGLPPRHDRRTESLLRIQGSTRPDRLGLSYQAGVQITSWSADSASADTILGRRSVNRAFAGLRVAGRGATADVVARVSDYHTPIEVELTTGWTVLPWVVLAGGGRWASHRFDRTSRSAWGSLGFHAGHFSLVGDLRWADAVAAPILETDTAQTTLDLGARLGFTSGHFTLHGGLERRDAFTAPPLTEIPDIPRFPTAAPATYFLGDLTAGLGPLWLTATLSQPVAGVAPAFEPPTHGRMAITFRSKFFRTFRSGAFELKVQLAVESWSAGSAGVDATGAAVPLAGASVAQAYLQVELAHFHAFYSLANALRARDTWVPGFEYPRNRQTFGVKWIFQN